MDDPMTAAHVRTILERPSGHRWVMQDIGLLALWLDGGHEQRLHVWSPAHCVTESPIHDHPYDFTSTVIAGELTNVRYEESTSGTQYCRERYAPPDEQSRVTDLVRLAGTSTTYTAGESYEQLAPELHGSTQVPGTVTILRPVFHETAELTVCHPPGREWVSGRSRPASPEEVSTITALALGHMA